MGKIVKYKLLVSGTVEDLNKQVEKALTEGLQINAQPWLFTKGWELYEKPVCSQSSDKTPRGHSYTDKTFAQAIIIREGNIVIDDRLDEFILD